MREWKASGCNALADKGNTAGVRRKINGGTNGFDEARTWLAKADRVFIEMPATPPPVAAIMTEYEVRVLQQQLQDALYTEVRFVDGKMGTRTRAALFAFQTDNNLPATGEMNAETRPSSSPMACRPVISRQSARIPRSARPLNPAVFRPAAQAVIKGGWWAKVQAVFTTLAASICGAWESWSDALSAVSSFKEDIEDILAAGPWLFFAAMIGISLVLWLRSGCVVEQTVRAVQLGPDTGA